MYFNFTKSSSSYKPVWLIAYKITATGEGYVEIDKNIVNINLIIFLPERFIRYAITRY